MSKELTLIEHFEELRKRIVHFLYGFAVIFLLVSIWTKEIADYLFLPYYKFLDDPSQKLAYTSITDVFIFYFKMISIVTLFLSAPWLFYQLWLFISPALKKNEKRFVLPFVIFTSFFMMGGMAFAFYVVLPLTFRFFFELNKDYRNIVTISSIWNFEFLMIVGVGICFETPILIFVLNRIGVVTTKILLKFSRWAILLSFIISAIITPSGDPFTQTVVALPMVILYFIGILLTLIFPSKRGFQNETNQ